MEEKILQEFFSNNLKRLLEERGKTQLELSKYIGVSNTTINNYVKGYNMPRMNKLDKICEFFNISRSELIDPPPTPQSIDDLDFTGINRIAAHFSGDDFSEEDLNEIQSFINYVKSKKQNGV